MMPPDADLGARLCTAAAWGNVSPLMLLYQIVISYQIYNPIETDWLCCKKEGFSVNGGD